MKFLKIVGIGVLALVALVVILFLVSPKAGYYESSVVLDSPREKIFRVVNDMSIYNEWSPWYAIDPDAQYSWEGPDQGPGAKMSWISDHPDVGNGAMWIHDHSANEEVAYKMSFEGYPSEPISRVIMHEDESGTVVKWTYEDNETPGLFRIGNLFGYAKTMLEEPYAKGLQNLKTYVENLPDNSISITDMPAMPYAGMMATVASGDSQAISSAMGNSYGKLMTFIQENQREMQGMPFAIYTAFDDETLTMICGLPIDNTGLTGTEEIIIGQINAGRSIKAIHEGPYESLHLTHTAVSEFMSANNLTAGGAPYEIYITDPGEEPDPNKWITWVIYPL